MRGLGSSQQLWSPSSRQSGGAGEQPGSYVATRRHRVRGPLRPREPRLHGPAPDRREADGEVHARGVLWPRHKRRIQTRYVEPTQCGCTGLCGMKTRGCACLPSGAAAICGTCASHRDSQSIMISAIRSLRHLRHVAHRRCDRTI